MPSYAVSFHIHSDNGYSDRYNSLMEQIKKPPSNYVWDETTSFALVETTESLSEFALRLYTKSSVSSLTDKLLVIDHTISAAYAFGKIEYPTLLSTKFKSCTIL